MTWWKTLTGRKRREFALRKELEFHGTERLADLMRSGIPEQEARMIIRQEFGGLDQVADAWRDVLSMAWLETLARDIKIGFRTLRRSPGVTITAVATLAVAIGANTAIFSLVSSALLRPLPYPEPDRIVQFWFTTPGGRGLTLSVPDINAVAAETDTFEAVAAYDFGGPGVSIGGGADPELVTAVHVSAAYFRILGARTILGRTCTADEDRPNGGRAVVLSYPVWHNRFLADSAIAGKTILLGGEPYTVTGVLSPEFHRDPPAQVWLPLQTDPGSTSHAHYLRALGRLRPGVSVEQANARLKHTFASFRRRFPVINPQAGFEAHPFRETRAGDVRAQLMVLFGAVGFVLLIGCANVANLLLAKAAVRRHEMALRSALGGTRRRLMAQMLTECGLIAALGGILGLAAGQVCLRLLFSLSSEAIPNNITPEQATLDWRVLLFAALVSVGVTFVCGLLPALRSSGLGLNSSLQSGGSRVGTGPGTARAGTLLIVVEVALAVVLVSGAGLMIRTFIALRGVQTGLDTRGILTLQMSLQGTRLTDTKAVTSLVNRGVERLRTIPRVAAVATTWTLPIEELFGSSFIIEGRPLGNEKVHGPAGMRPVSAGYTAVFGIPVKRGRFFTDRDTGTSPSVAVISEAMAKRFWPSGNPLGERITLDKYLGPEFASPPREIVGVVGDVRDTGLNQEPGPTVYIPQSQMPDGMTAIDLRSLPITWVIRTAGEPYAVANKVKQELKSASGGLATGHVRSMEDVIRQSTLRSDFITGLLAAFAIIALLLAAIGIYGLLSFSINERTRELGIRATLGATPTQLRGMVVRHGLSLTAGGVLLGVAGSVALARSMETLLFGVKATNPAILLGACAFLILVAVMALYLPARRAARLDPMKVLRAG